MLDYPSNYFPPTPKMYLNIFHNKVLNNQNPSLLPNKSSKLSPEIRQSCPLSGHQFFADWPKSQDVKILSDRPKAIAPWAENSLTISNISKTGNFWPTFAGRLTKGRLNLTPVKGTLARPDSKKTLFCRTLFRKLLFWQHKWETIAALVILSITRH